MFGLRIEQPAIGAANAVRAQCLFQIVGLQQHGEAGDGPFPAGADASEVSAVQMCSFTSGVMVTPSRIKIAAIQSAAQDRS